MCNPWNHHFFLFWTDYMWGKPFSFSIAKNVLCCSSLYSLLMSWSQQMQPVGGLFCQYSAKGEQHKLHLQMNHNWTSYWFLLCQTLHCWYQENRLVKSISSNLHVPIENMTPKRTQVLHMTGNYINLYWLWTVNLDYVASLKLGRTSHLWSCNPDNVSHFIYSWVFHSSDGNITSMPHAPMWYLHSASAGAVDSARLSLGVALCQ